MSASFRVLPLVTTTLAVALASTSLTHNTLSAQNAWRGSIFSGGMVGEVLARLTLDGQRVTGEEQLVQRRGRIRDVRQGPDGFIYPAIDDRANAPSAIVRLEPARP